MKHVIKTLLNTGYSRTHKGAEILKKYWMIRPLVILLDNGNLKAISDAFWNEENEKNRLELSQDIALTRSCTIADRATCYICNRFATGDAYGITDILNKLHKYVTRDD